MLGISKPENYLTSSKESMTYEHHSEEAARKRLESEFNDDEDYLVAGTPAPSIRNHLISTSSSSSRAPPPDYHEFTSQRSGGGMSAFGRYDSMGGGRNGGGYGREPNRYSTSRTISSSSYGQPSSPPRGASGARWEDRGGDRGGDYTERKYSSYTSQASPRDDRNSSDLYRSAGRDIADDYPRNRFGSSYENGLPKSSLSSWKSNGSPERFSRGYSNGTSDYRDSRGGGGGYDDSYRRTSDGRYSPERSYGRQGSKLLYDGAADAKEKERRFYQETRSNPKPPEEREFLGKVQKELEEQRREWKDEIDRLSNSTLMPSASTTFNVAKNNTIDTSSGQAIFKAFVDVSEFSPQSVKVNVDKLTNKVVVEAKQNSASGGLAKSFTQKIQLPRFADDHNLVARMNKKGILKIEVPLVFYFPEQETTRNDGKAKSFVYEVRTDPETGRKIMEILVNTGRDMSSRDLKVEMEGDKLQIWADRPSGSSGSGSPVGGDPRRSLIKQYTMPPNADTNNIRIERTKDGRHAILIPLF